MSINIQHELYENLSFDSSYHTKFNFNSSSEHSNFCDNLKFVISPKKAENETINAAQKKINNKLYQEK